MSCTGYISNKIPVLQLAVRWVPMQTSTCLSWGLPTQLDNWLKALAILAVLAEESLTQACFQTLSQPLASLAGWQSQLSLSKDPGVPIDPCIHSIILFISMIGTYRSLFKYLVRLTTQRILGFFDCPCPAGQVHSKLLMHTDFVTELLSNNFVSLLSDL